LVKLLRNYDDVRDQEIMEMLRESKFSTKKIAKHAFHICFKTIGPEELIKYFKDLSKIEAKKNK